MTSFIWFTNLLHSKTRFLFFYFFNISLKLNILLKYRYLQVLKIRQLFCTTQKEMAFEAPFAFRELTSFIPKNFIFRFVRANEAPFKQNCQNLNDRCTLELEFGICVVGKNEKLESSTWNRKEWSWKDRAEVGKFLINLERINEVGKETFQLLVFSNRRFPWILNWTIRP